MDVTNILYLYIFSIGVIKKSLELTGAYKLLMIALNYENYLPGKRRTLF